MSIDQRFLKHDAYYLIGDYKFPLNLNQLTIWLVEEGANKYKRPVDFSAVCLFEGD